MKALSFLPLCLLLLVSLVGCSDDEATPAVTADSGDFGDGPTTGRPDDGPDTGTAVTDTGSAEETSTDAPASDSGAADATTDGG